jgi:hypothetical protein
VREALLRDLEAARYAADRAFRQYDAADPANRVVAAELEARWNRTLLRIAEVEAKIAERPHRETAGKFAPAVVSSGCSGAGGGKRKSPARGRALRSSQNRLINQSARLDCSGGFLFSPRTHRSAGRPTASPTSCPKDSSSELPSGSAIRAT